MDAEKVNGIRDARARGEILKLVRLRHKAQESRMDHVELWHMLRGIGIDVGENDVLTFLQDLETLEFLGFDSEKDRFTNRPTITHIQLRPRGIAVLERRVQDDSVLL